MSSEQLLTKLVGIENGLLRAAAALGIKGLSEITEEELQLVLAPVYRSIVFGEAYDAPTVEEFIYTAIVSFAMTGIVESGDIASYARNRPAQSVEWDFADAEVDPDGNVGYDGDTESYKSDGVNPSFNTETEYAGKPIELTVRDNKFLDVDGNVDWETWAPNGGRVPGTIQESQTLKAGTIIDRYGNPYGKYASPWGVSYEQRALPYVENSDAYHRYEVLKPINDVVISQIAEAFEQPGGGIQYELPATVHRLIKEGYLREIVE